MARGKGSKLLGSRAGPQHREVCHARDTLRPWRRPPYTHWLHRLPLQLMLWYGLHKRATIHSIATANNRLEGISDGCLKQSCNLTLCSDMSTCC